MLQRHWLGNYPPGVWAQCLKVFPSMLFSHRESNTLMLEKYGKIRNKLSLESGSLTEALHVVLFTGTFVNTPVTVLLLVAFGCYNLNWGATLRQLDNTGSLSIVTVILQPDNTGSLSIIRLIWLIASRNGHQSKPCMELIMTKSHTDWKNTMKVVEA